MEWNEQDIRSEFYPYISTVKKWRSVTGAYLQSNEYETGGKGGGTRVAEPSASVSVKGNVGYIRY